MNLLRETSSKDEQNEGNLSAEPNLALLASKILKEPIFSSNNLVSIHSKMD